MATRPSTTHWLRENAQERSPHRVLVVDTEALPVSSAPDARQELRLWCAKLRRRRGDRPKLPRTERYRGHTADELAELVDRLAKADRTLWLYTHNLNYDLALTALPVLLTDRGWRITEGALTTDDPWCRLSKGSRRLAIADSWSYLPAGLETIGLMLGLRKVALPEWDESEEAWWARCERDVDIADKALAQLMDWWDAGQYGNWSITGPATGWSSYRHRRPRPRVLIDPDPVARALEARAVTGGRRQVWRTGRLPNGLYADLDLATAHLVVMSERLLPMRRLRRFDQLEQDAHELHSTVLDVLAECEVETSSPRYPWDSGRGVFYPTGRFRSVLAGPEIRSALERGELRSIGQGYVYVLGSHMQAWARWLASLLAVESPDVPPMVRLAAKHWSRCVPGKWAGHSSEVIRRTPDPRPGWSVERGYLVDLHRSADFLRIGGELWTIARDEWADDAFPAILAWIQAHTRLAIGRLIDRLGPAAVSANTDGVLADVAQVALEDGGRIGDTRLAPTHQLQLLDELCLAWDPLVAPFTVRIKAAASAVTVISPQHLILDRERRLAGIPNKAQSLGDGRFRFTQWPRLRVQLSRPAPAGYQTVRRTVNLDAIPPTGWLWTDGTVTPAQVEGGRLCPPPFFPWAPGPDPDLRLAARQRQHPLLQRAIPDEAPVPLAPEPTKRPRWREVGRVVA